MKTYSSREVCRTAGISYRQLDYWERSGYIEASVAARGAGTQRLWNEQAKRHVVHVAQLRRAGFSLDVAAALADAHERGECDVERMLLFVLHDARAREAA